MRTRGAALVATLGVTLAVSACGHREQSVVDNYFRAVNAEDTQTLSSFAVVRFEDGKPESWKITSASEEQRGPAALPRLLGEVDEIQAQLDANKKEYNAYFLDHPQEVDEVRELLKGDGNIPSRLQTYAEEWQKFVDKEKELKGALADANNAVSAERKNVTLSVGADAVEQVSHVVEKTLQLELVVEGQTKPYTMTLRRYEGDAEGGQRMLSRWVIFGLQAA